MTNLTAAADAARDLLDETAMAIESADLSNRLFDPATVPEVQRSMDRAMELSGSIPAPDLSSFPLQFDFPPHQPEGGLPHFDDPTVP